MLQAIRERTGGIIGGIIIALLIIPFAFWGVDSWQSDQIEDWVAKVNDTEITPREFQRKYSLEQQRLVRQFGQDSFDAAFFQDPVRKREFLETLIAEELILQYGTEAGLAVSDAEVQASIAADPGFQAGGVFDPELYRRILPTQGHTTESWPAMIRRARLINQFRDGVVNSALVTDAERDSLLRLRDQTRSFRYINVASDAYRDAVEISEEEIATYYQENSDDFLSQERVTIEYIELDGAALSAEVEVTDGTLAERYETEKLRFTTPERRLASHILLELPPGADEDAKQELLRQAEDLTARARAGEDFAELALAYSDDVASKELGGDLDWIETGVMVEAFEEALFALEENAVSDPVETQFGYHVIWLRNIDEARGQTFEEVRDQLAEEYREEQSDRLFLDAHKRLVDLAYEHEDSLAPAAEDLGLELVLSEPFARSGGEGVLANPELLEIAFSAQVLEEKRNSDSIDIGPNHVAVIRVVDHEPSTLRPLEDVRDEVVEALTSAKADELAKARADELLARLEQGESLDQIAEAEGLEIIDGEAVTRNALIHDRTLVTGVFELPRPAEGEVSASVATNIGTAVVVLSEVSEGDLSEVADTLLDQAASSRKNDYLRAEYTAAIAALRAQAEVSVAEDRL